MRFNYNSLYAAILLGIVGIGIVVYFFLDKKLDDEAVRSWGFTQTYTTTGPYISAVTTSTTTTL